VFKKKRKKRGLEGGRGAHCEGKYGGNQFISHEARIREVSLQNPVRTLGKGKGAEDVKKRCREHARKKKKTTVTEKERSKKMCRKHRDIREPIRQGEKKRPRVLV